MSGDGMPGGFPGMPGGFPGMNMEMMQAMMNDPNIRRMTEAIAQDPVFQEMAREMQEAMLSGGMGGLNLGEGEDAGAAPAGMPRMPAIDPAKYMEAMSRVMENPEFLSAAETLGRGLMSQSLSPEDQAMLEIFQNPNNQAALKKRMEDLKEDPELTQIMQEVEDGGQGALMKYMNDPEIMAKIGRKFQEALNDPEFRSQLEGADRLDAIQAGEVGEEEEEEDVVDENSVISVAAHGMIDRLKELLANKDTSPDEKDEEGRTALHFASGYGEYECIKVLLENGANINATDNSKNSALHYAAGYGDATAAEILIEKGIDVSIKNDEDKTAQQVAELNEQTELVAMLQKSQSKAEK